MNMRLLDYFADVTDPRVERTKSRKLENILAIAICATICGADGWTEMAFFGECMGLRKQNGFRSDCNR